MQNEICIAYSYIREDNKITSTILYPFVTNHVSSLLSTERKPVHYFYDVKKDA